MHRIALALLLYLASPLLAQAPAPAGFVRLYGNNFLDNPPGGLSGAVPLASGKVCVQPFVKGQVLGLGLAGGTQLSTNPLCSRIVNGGYSLNVPDTFLASTQNACLLTTFSDAAGNIVRRIACLQPGSGPATTNWCTTAGGSTSCNLDYYSEPQPALAIQQPGLPGPPGPQGPPGTSGVGSQFLDSNGNLNVPANGSINVAGTKAVFHALNFGNGNYHSLGCDYFVATAYTGQGQLGPNCQVLNALFLEPGWSSTSSAADPTPGAPRWMVPSALQLNVRSYTTGITNGLGVVGQKTAGGDFNLLNVYGSAKQAATNGADEYAVFLRNSSGELTPPMGGVAVNTTNAATLLSVNCVANCGNLGPQHPLIETNPAKVVTATLTAAPVITVYPTGSNGNYATLTFPGTPFIPSNCAVLTASVATPQQKITQKTPMTLSLGTQSGLSFSGFAAGQTIVMGGPAFWESATVAASPGAFSSGTQTVTASLTYPHDVGGIVCAGGLAGWYAEQATFTTLANNVKYMFYVLATPTTNTAIVAQNGPGYFASNFFPGVYNFYPGATVTDASGILALYNRDPLTGQVNGVGTGTITVGLDVNTMSIAPGDPLVNASLAGAGYVNVKSLLNVNNPFAEVDGIEHHVYSPSLFGQPAFSAVAEYTAAQLANPYLVPGPLLRGMSTHAGPYASGLFLQEYPVGGKECGNYYPAAMLAIWCRNGPAHPFDLFGDYTTTPNYRIRYNPATGDTDASSMATFELPAATKVGGVLVNTAGVPGPQGVPGTPAPTTFTSIQILDSATSGPNAGVVHTCTIANGSFSCNP